MASSDDQMLKTLREGLNRDPANLDLANRYWNALASYKGHDIRSGKDVVQTYKDAALKSREGAAAFARAYRQLFEMSGEGPRAAFFDESLIQALQAWAPQLPEPERSTVRWLLQSIARV
jgi:hypothetical protein